METDHRNEKHFYSWIFWYRWKIGLGNNSTRFAWIKKQSDGHFEYTRIKALPINTCYKYRFLIDLVCTSTGMTHTKPQDSGWELSWFGLFTETRSEKWDFIVQYHWLLYFNRPFIPAFKYHSPNKKSCSSLDSRLRSYCAAVWSPETSGSILPPSKPPRKMTDDTLLRPPIDAMSVEDYVGEAVLRVWFLKK